MPEPTPADDLISAFWRWVAWKVSPHVPEFLTRPPRPGRVSAQLIREVDMALVYKPILPPPGAPDVVKRELSVALDGGEPTVIDATDAAEFTAAEGQSVTLTLVDIDDAGNRSEPSPAYTFTAEDTIAPPAPGELGVELIREDADAPDEDEDDEDMTPDSDA